MFKKLGGCGGCKWRNRRLLHYNSSECLLYALKTSRVLLWTIGLFHFTRDLCTDCTTATASSMGQSGFMVKKCNLPPLLSFSALLVCILPHCRLRDWCGNLRKVSGHVVCLLDQSASFRIFDSTFYFPHSAIPHFTHSLHWGRFSRFSN